MNNAADQGRVDTLRWGFVGTGRIARSMAEVLRDCPVGALAAVTSRRLSSARAFAAEFGARSATDSLDSMLADDVDAVYVATPTGVREAIAVAAARAGKHVLAEKPFASVDSLERIVDACREADVCFMDATHFVHHPRYTAVQRDADTLVGRPRTLDSSFRIPLPDRSDIRYDVSLEPLGALGDLGWYNLRAALEYLVPEQPIGKARASLRRDPGTGAIVAAEGRLLFDDDSVSTWRCGFDTSRDDIALELSGPRGTLRMEHFTSESADGSASYRYAGTRAGDAAEKLIRVDSRASGAALMFEDFAAAAASDALRERWARASLATQGLLDAVMQAADG